MTCDPRGGGGSAQVSRVEPAPLAEIAFEMRALDIRTNMAAATSHRDDVVQRRRPRTLRIGVWVGPLTADSAHPIVLFEYPCPVDGLVGHAVASRPGPMPVEAVAPHPVPVERSLALWLAALHSTFVVNRFTAVWARLTWWPPCLSAQTIALAPLVVPSVGFCSLDTRSRPARAGAVGGGRPPLTPFERATAVLASQQRWIRWCWHGASTSVSGGRTFAASRPHFVSQDSTAGCG